MSYRRVIRPKKGPMTLFNRCNVSNKPILPAVRKQFIHFLNFSGLKQPYAKQCNNGLTLWILTTHICVENTVLASMNCFLFNLSYNVMIIWESHQLMYIAIITPSKPATPPGFRCISPFVWQQSPKCQFCAQITTLKLTFIYR